jgi:von Willebrand factor type A domain
MSSHNQVINRSNKALMVFLIDHSGSMGEVWEKNIVTNEEILKKDKVAQIVNTTLGTLVRQGGDISAYVDRLDVALIGYGSSVGSAFEGDLAGADVVTAFQLREKYVAQEGVAEIKYVTPHDEKGGTEMSEAFKYTKRIVEDWVKNNPNNYPPTVFHITDGDYTGTSPENVMEGLKNISTTDGQTILWNLHISAKSEGESMLPKDFGEISTPRAQELCKWASVLPVSDRRFKADVGKYCFAYNAKPDDIEDCLAIGSQAFM